MRKCTKKKRLFFVCQILVICKFYHQDLLNLNEIMYQIDYVVTRMDEYQITDKRILFVVLLSILDGLYIGGYFFLFLSINSLEAFLSVPRFI